MDAMESKVRSKMEEGDRVSRVDAIREKMVTRVGEKEKSPLAHVRSPADIADMRVETSLSSSSDRAGNQGHPYAHAHAHASTRSGVLLIPATARGRGGCRFVYHGPSLPTLPVASPRPHSLVPWSCSVSACLQIPTSTAAVPLLIPLVGVALL
jgi:hypothetical protein